MFGIVFLLLLLAGCGLVIYILGGDNKNDRWEVAGMLIGGGFVLVGFIICVIMMWWPIILLLGILAIITNWAMNN